MNKTIFEGRHIGPSVEEVNEMLATLNQNSLDNFIKEVIPESIQSNKKLDLPEAMGEGEFINHIHQLSLKNKTFKNYIGMGYHPTNLLGVIQRNILENPGWYTAYTPYQPEISQGRLEALLNFQTVVCDLTAMELANASLLDEGTAAAEAMAMLFNTRTRSQAKENTISFFVSEGVLPQTISILKTRATPLGINLVIGNHEEIELGAQFFGALLQYPSKSGEIIDYSEFMNQAENHSVKVVISADLLALTLLKPPGEWGATVVVGSTQRFGIPMGFGGPHAAYFATKDEYKRAIPGRIIGVTKDKLGNTAMRMALQTREQHIKREKATSNICTSQVLLAVMAGMYAVYHGPDGLKKIAQRIHELTLTLYKGLHQCNLKIIHDNFFDTLSLEVSSNKRLKEKAESEGVNLYYPNDHVIQISLNETTTEEDVQGLITIFSEIFKGDKSEKELEIKSSIPENSQRKSSYLNEDLFKKYRSETAMMRYIKKLERKDLSLNHSMISLGSCTMKLNAATQMLPLSWPNWNSLHPFAPSNQTKGYQEVIQGLESALNEITGLSATSLQPNSGAQGEFAGLLLIRAYHHSRGEEQRNICLIPSSAHGTNPASAVMAGMKVVIVKSTEKGNIDIVDLEEKVLTYKDHLAALMVTYPSTHGVFESSIKKVTSLIHQYGGQVYLDGANMNAQVGLTNPGIIGADVCHLNLHKTFAIPHGGGGPGVGPICVASHLAPFLPSHPLVSIGNEKSISAISAAPWGSALVLLISYSYIKMLGAKGLTNATKIAILNANYIRRRLEEHYTILYRGENNHIAHELIVDFRAFKSRKIEVVDIAKRLIDYGFHAPTVSFPVAGTLMIEPTESENKEEIDRFCDALIEIKKEIFEVEEHLDTVLKNAPHTLQRISSDEWTKSYSRKKAAFPLPYVTESKFWPSVERVDEAYGDRNLICTCASIEDYKD